MNENSLTPRTNAVWKPVRLPKRGKYFYFKFADNCRDTEYDFACKLELELKETYKEIQRLKTELKTIHYQIAAALT